MFVIDDTLDNALDNTLESCDLGAVITGKL